MDRNNNLHRRRSIRLRDYNYAQAGMYFVTICTQKHLCFFGDIVNGKMQLNAAGEMIQKWFLELANKFHDIRCGEFVCMPNHVHFIVINTGVDLCVHPDREHASVGANLCVRPDPDGAHTGAPLPDVVRWFKTMTSNEYNRGVKSLGWPAFPGKLWQRNYYEHIIREELSYLKITEYIQTNPQKWNEDIYHV